MSETANHTWQTTVQPRVQSWMDHEDRCVTVQRLVQAFPSVSRWQASQWLQELASARPQTCQITTCRQERTKEGDTPMTVFRLRQSTKVVATDGEDASVFAVASMEVTESVTTAHERDMVEWREMVADGRFHEVDAGAGVGAIASADAIRPLQHLVSDKQAVIAKPQTASNNNIIIISSSNSNSNGGSSSHRHKAFAGKAKVTTAASFFGKSKSSDTAASSSETKKTPAVTTKKTVIPTTLKATAPRPTRAKENKRRTNQVAPAPENEKSFSNNNNKKRNVGNADDFVADEEDSDDDEKEEETSRKASIPKQSRQEKAAAAAQRQAVEEANRESLQELPEDEDAEPAVRGAMDAFATKETKSKPAASDNSSRNQQSRHKKRRKKLVEKTTMVNGYLRTETQVVWEDVPSDEEEEEEQEAMARKKATEAKKAFGGSSSGKSSAQGMKQKSLMGFFAKK